MHDMKLKLLSIIKYCDQMLSRSYLKVFKDNSSLIIFYFHGLFRNKDEINLNLVNPLSHRGLTIEHLKRLIEYFLNLDYTFISTHDILNGLNIYKNYVMITFDDGYSNNLYALPILKEYNIPAVFFISTNHVKLNKCFWSDVLYRESVRSGISMAKISREIERLKFRKSDDIERYIAYQFGEKAFKPKSDVDRPLNASELKDISRENCVILGNHTSDHAILTNYTAEEIKMQIIDCQNAIYDITGISPKIISYPCGKYSADVLRISKEIGLELGFTIDPKKNYLPIKLQGNHSMRLGRISLQCNNKLIRQFEIARSDFALYNSIRNTIKRA